MNFHIIDAESDGLLDKVTKIHVVSYMKFENFKLVESGSITDYDKMRYFLENEVEILIGHNVIRYDLPLFTKILGIKEFYFTVVDTLSLSWYLFPFSNLNSSPFKHGLAYWGERLGFPKPEVEDWENLPIEVYIERCEADVEINKKLFFYLLKLFRELYIIGNDKHLPKISEDPIMRAFRYLSFKIDCIKDQELRGIPFDKILAKKHKEELGDLLASKYNELSAYMPKVTIKKKPIKLIKKDGKLTVAAKKWFEELKDLGLPHNSKAIYQEGNPGSHVQLKDWLLTLGWKPQTFKESKVTGERVPQVNLPFGGGLCPSVKELFEVYPYLENLNQLGQIKHRFGLVESFLNNERNGRVYASAHGFTNTLRLRHSVPVVNLPKTSVFWGKGIRELLTVPNENYTMIGCDVSSLEDSTKQHYLYFFDPDYVNEMRVPGFDPHLDIGVLAGLITEKEVEFYKWADEAEDLSFDEQIRYLKIKKARNIAKTANFAATYGAQAPKIAETAKISLKEAELFFNTYWERNKAIRKVEKNLHIKKVNGVSWILNPVSNLWMYLKNPKDIFSTLNQSTGVYVFDTWLKYTRKLLNQLTSNPKILLQYHDEYMFIIHSSELEIAETIPFKAMELTNKELNLNVEIKISLDVGNNYASVH